MVKTFYKITKKKLNNLNIYHNGSGRLEGIIEKTNLKLFPLESCIRPKKFKKPYM